MSTPTPMPEIDRSRGLRFARRAWPTRSLGFALGALSFGSVYWQNQAPALLWAAFLLFCFGWPHLAYALARRSANPARTESISLVFECGVSGVWVALAGFNLLPSALSVAMFGMDRMSVGGPKLALRALAAMVVGAVVAALAFRVELHLESNLATVVASLPVLIFYPIAVGAVVFRQGRRMSEQNRRLAELSRIDGLSQLLNHVSWRAAVSAEYERSMRHGRLASLLMIDVDFFKEINDRHGHSVGDRVIRRVSEILTDCARRTDVVGRCGGEEFGILLPETAAQSASMMAERIRARIEHEPLCEEPPVRATVSIGIAPLTGQGIAGHDGWIVAADRALYEAKRQGRNRNVLASAPAEAA